jgi:hypothetical protein
MTNTEAKPLGTMWDWPFLIQEHRDAPFFVFLHVFDPHSPFPPASTL